MSFRKKFLVLTTICITGLTCYLCFSQVVTFNGFAPNWVWIRQSALFSIIETNRFWRAESTNWIHCRLENRSTNQIAFESAVNFSIVTLYSGKRIPLNTQTKQPEKRHLNIDETYEWDEAMLIITNKDIQMGQYYGVSVSAPIIDGISNHDADIFIPALEVVK
jgi:hypothetical protein